MATDPSADTSSTEPPSPAVGVPVPPEDITDEDRKQQAIDEWLPITSSRNAKWWYAAFHNVTAMVGAGVLTLPSAMSHLGWGPGTAILIMSWIITLYTLWQMVEMHEMVPGKRFDRYHELGQQAFGEKLGLYIVVPQQLICEVGVDIVYMVTGGQSLKKIHELLCKDCKSIKTYFLDHDICFNPLSAVEKGRKPEVSYEPTASTTAAGAVFNFFAALGEVAFAYAGHNVALEIQATIPSTEEKPSKEQGAVAVAATIPSDNLLGSLQWPMPLLSSMLLAATRFICFRLPLLQLFAMPVFDMIETVLVKKLHFKPTKTLRFVARNTYIALTMFVGMSFPFFGSLLSFFGGFAFAPTTYFQLPCIIWLSIYKPKMFSLSWFANWTCIILGLMLMILAPIGALRNIILHAKEYKFYN
ncbi:Lysine histidine transporter 1 [Linum perenne]